MDGGQACCKYLMFFFNLLIFLGGSALVGIGVWVIVGTDSFKSIVSTDASIFNAVYVIIAVGAFLLIVGFLGCCGAIKENKCLLGTFFTVVLILFVLEIVGGVLAFVYFPQAEKAAKDSMLQYGQSTESGAVITESWDAIQETFKCCGWDSPADWLIPALSSIFTGGDSYPTSCGGLTEALARPGCKEAVQGYFLILGGVAIGILFVELLAMIFACCVMRGVGKDRYA